MIAYTSNLYMFMVEKNRKINKNRVSRHGHWIKKLVITSSTDIRIAQIWMYWKGH